MSVPNDQYEDMRDQVLALRAENERLQAVNDQLKAGLDATAEANGELRADLREAQHDLAETRRALDEARHVSGAIVQELDAARKSTMSRRDWYVCAALAGVLASGESYSHEYCVSEADALMAVADREVKP